MPRFEVRERVTFDVVDTQLRETNPMAFVYEDGVIVLNSASREEADRVAAEHEEHFENKEG